MEMKDYLEAKALLGNDHGLSQYEQIKVGHMNRRASGTAIAGLCVGIGAAVAAVGVGAWATAKASEARRVASAENAGTAALLRSVTEQVVRDHNESITRDFNITNTITDTQSGSQQGQLSASQVATNEATAQILSGVMTGRYVEKPQPVALYQDARPCACPQSGCGCNG